MEEQGIRAAFRFESGPGTRQVESEAFLSTRDQCSLFEQAPLEHFMWGLH
jgi:hypothetical protein